MTNEERDALVFGVEIRDTDEDGEEVTTLFVDGERVWSDTHFEPEDILLGRDLRAFVKVIRKLAKERHEARAQLAALHAAATAVQTKARALPVSMTEIVHAEEWDDLDRVLANTATATAEHDARVRAPVEAERDQLATALDATKRVATVFANAVATGDEMVMDVALQRMRETFAAIPADLAAQREARTRADERAKALREAADRIERHDGDAHTDAEAYRREGRESAACTLRAMADEAERGGA